MRLQRFYTLELRRNAEVGADLEVVPIEPREPSVEPQIRSFVGEEELEDQVLTDEFLYCPGKIHLNPVLEGGAQREGTTRQQKTTIIHCMHNACLVYELCQICTSVSSSSK